MWTVAAAGILVGYLLGVVVTWAAMREARREQAIQLAVKRAQEVTAGHTVVAIAAEDIPSGALVVQVTDANPQIVKPLAEPKD